MDNSENKPSPAQKLLSDLVDQEQAGRQIYSNYKFIRDPLSWVDPGSLTEILDVPREAFGQKGMLSIEILEDIAKNVDLRKSWIDFKWKLTAFNEIQDIFDSPIYPDASFVNIFHIWYFYYEARSLLKEVIVSGFVGLYSASTSVLRLFLEFSLLQLYFYRVCETRKSYEPLEEYFRNGRKPSWNTMLNKAIPNNAFCKPIKLLLDLHMKGLSVSAAHPYHPDLSPRHHSASPISISMEGILFWQTARFVLRTVLWAYYVNFPMLFHPRNMLEKFGFNAPMGTFIDLQGATSVRRSLENEGYDEFLLYSESNDDVQGLIEWYESYAFLTEDEIRGTWKDDGSIGELGADLEEGLCKQRTQMRVLKQAMALKPPEPLGPPDQIDDIFLSLSYTKWKELYKYVGIKSS